VIAQLDLAASAPTDQTHTLGASELRRYATELRKNHPTAEAGEVLALRLPEEISGAWNAAASDARLEMPRWIATALEKTPPECVAWEIKAAATCSSLGEWAYASSLRASASASA
jgi:16S rRNA C967 or C1407 C5-methylase (RsmB/RsmF family)